MNQNREGNNFINFNEFRMLVLGKEKVMDMKEKRFRGSYEEHFRITHTELCKEV